MKKISLVLSLLVVMLFSGVAHTDGLPNFLKNTLPEEAAADIMSGWGKIKGKGNVLDPKTTELIALAVAARIPCGYCVYAHSSTATKLGATEADIPQAWSTE